MLAHLILPEALQGWYNYPNLHMRKLDMRSSMNWLIEFRLRRQRKEWPQVYVNAFHYVIPKFSQHFRPTIAGKHCLISRQVGGRSGWEGLRRAPDALAKGGEHWTECTLLVPTQAVPSPQFYRVNHVAQQG